MYRMSFSEFKGEGEGGKGDIHLRDTELVGFRETK